mmetsp:Transcript_15935/g.34628  ORF Transcript_15935/g.34628 Transcript_15935/m.34628 type:complete len:667 (+) Transcript_15935:29-2029(+)
MVCAGDKFNADEEAVAAAARRILLAAAPGRFDCVLADLRGIVRLPTDCNEAWEEEIRIAHGKCNGNKNNTCKQRLSFLSRAGHKVHAFFHARTGPSGCRLSGYIRVAYALLFLYSRGLMAFDLEFLMDPRVGVMPYRATRHTRHFMDETNTLSIFRYFPDSPLVLYGTFYLGLVSGFLLLLGIAPRWQAASIYLVLCNMHSHSYILYDHQDVMLRLWAFFLVLLPLDHVTIRDGFGLRPAAPEQGQTTSWPMWPFQLWRIVTCLVYAGAGLGKASSKYWQSGVALYYCLYDQGFGFKLFDLDWLFNRMITIKLMTWPVAVLEALSWITIWPRSTRRITFIAVVLLHLGIELTMVMHIFQYLSVLGWIVFFVEPNDGRSSNGSNGGKATLLLASPSSARHRTRKTLESILIFVFACLFIIDQLPTGFVERGSPEAMRPFVNKYIHKPRLRLRAKVSPLLKMTGLISGAWHLYTDEPANEMHRYTAVIKYKGGTKPTVWRSPDFSNSAWHVKERNLWVGAYYDYIGWDDDDNVFPAVSALVERLACIYSDNGIAYDVEGGQLVIHPNNTVSSISLMQHWTHGVKPPNDLGWFEPARQKMKTGSTCLYVFNVPDLERPFGMVRQYAYDEDSEYDEQSGCVDYHESDDKYHQIGSFTDDSGLNGNGRDEL